jgi:hypothetical protein
MVKGMPVHLGLMSTRRPETAMRLFDDAAFPWWMQGQGVLLSVPDAPPPAIEEALLLALFGEQWTRHAASLLPLGIEGVVRPGVDGDVAGKVMTPINMGGAISALVLQTNGMILAAGTSFTG